MMIGYVSQTAMDGLGGEFMIVFPLGLGTLTPTSGTESVSQVPMPLDATLTTMVIRLTAFGSANAASYAFTVDGTVLAGFTLTLTTGQTGVHVQEGSQFISRSSLVAIDFSHTSDSGSLTLRGVSHSFSQ